MSEFKREGRYIVVKPDCEDSMRTEQLKNYIDEMCFNTPDCVVVEADWPEYEAVWRMIERRVAGLPEELSAAQSELAALREELAKTRESHESMRADLIATDERLTAAEQRNAECIALLRRSTSADGQDVKTWWNDRALILQAALKPTESGASE